MPGIRPAPRLSLLGLTALRLLHERPMHPYEMARLIRERRIDEVLQLKRGSLYHAVERLVRDGLVEALVARFDAVLRMGLDRVHVLAVEYARGLAAAELEWVRGVAADLRAGRL